VSGEPRASNRDRRRAATKAEIVEAAWQLARENGLTGVSMRDLGGAVGMSAQSIYSYFTTKNDIYDAMFADGNRAALADLAPLVDRFDVAGDNAPALVEAVRAAAHGFFDFCISDPTRYELLFQRTVRGFQPSEASYALAQQFLDLMASRLRAIDVDERGIDLWTAVMSGITSQQIANDDGTERWKALVDDAVEMLIRHLAPALHRRAARQLRGKKGVTITASVHS
jgi:AcrR family transcriptional regulator